MTKGQNMHTTETHAVEFLVTDSICYEVIRQTNKTISLRKCLSGEMVSGEWPVVYSAAVSNPEGETITLRLRKDGTFRRANWANPMRFTSQPAFRTDYAF
jgi:hypothetical protein